MFGDSIYLPVHESSSEHRVSLPNLVPAILLVCDPKSLEPFAGANTSGPALVDAVIDLLKAQTPLRWELENL